MQNKKVFVYTSRQLDHDLELDSIVFALNIWRHYLFGAHFIVFSDHKSLKYLFNQRKLNMRQGRWIEFLKYYDFALQYHPGKANVVTNALSRKKLHVSTLMEKEQALMEDFKNMSLDVSFSKGRHHWGLTMVTSDF